MVDFFFFFSNGNDFCGYLVHVLFFKIISLGKFGLRSSLEFGVKKYFGQNRSLSENSYAWSEEPNCCLSKTNYQFLLF